MSVKTIRLIFKPRKYQKMIKATSPRMMKGDLADRGKDHIQMMEHNQDYSEDGKW